MLWDLGFWKFVILLLVNKKKVKTLKKSFKTSLNKSYCDKSY